LPRVVRSVRVSAQMRTAWVWASSRTPRRCAASAPHSRTRAAGSRPRATATDSSGLSYRSAAQALTRVMGSAASSARRASATCQPARPPPTMTTPASPWRRATGTRVLLAARSASMDGASYSEKSALVTPHSGQAQSSGMSS
jgi:hypothetical protein